MTWRAFIIGILAIVGFCWLTPYNDIGMGNSYLAGNHLPVGPFFTLIALTLVLNVGLKVVRRRWVLGRSELIFVWMMMTVAATVPGSGLMRYLWPNIIAPAYYAGRPEITWEEDALPATPDELIVTKDLHSVAARRFFEGARTPEEARVPWWVWWRPMLPWGIFLATWYLSVIFLCSLLRKQWVESERLIFPLVRVPLEFTEGAGGRGLLPPVVTSTPFLLGAGFTLLFGLMRVLPVLTGAEEGWLPTVPIGAVLQDTALSPADVGEAVVYPLGVGIAFLVPSDVSLSIWFFYIFTRGELQTAYWLGRPLEGGTWGPFMARQMAGGFFVFTIALFWSARRQLARVFRKATGLDSSVDDSGEPIGYRLTFWGLLASLGAMVGWFVYYRVHPLTALGLVALFVSLLLVHARLVCQGGLLFTQHNWRPIQIVHGWTGGAALGHVAGVVAALHNAIFTFDAAGIFSPHAMNALRASSVFQRRRRHRWFLPAVLAALAVALVVSGWSSMRVYYRYGAYNIPQNFGTVNIPRYTYNFAQQNIRDPARLAEPHVGATLFGAGFMGFLVFMRSRFYWWPIHSLGFLVSSVWAVRRLWFSFFLGWLAKTGVLRLGGGKLLRSARVFFIAMVVAEIFVAGTGTAYSLITGNRIGFLFLPS